MAAKLRTAGKSLNAGVLGIAVHVFT